MHAPGDTTTPPRSVMRRLITPWEYQHLHAVAGVRLAAGGFHLGIGVVLLSLGHHAGELTGSGANATGGQRGSW